MAGYWTCKHMTANGGSYRTGPQAEAVVGCAPAVLAEQLHWGLRHDEGQRGGGLVRGGQAGLVALAEALLLHLLAQQRVWTDLLWLLSYLLQLPFGSVLSAIQSY